jgi:hypothetical protein
LSYVGDENLLIVSKHLFQFENLYLVKRYLRTVTVSALARTAADGADEAGVST